MEHIEQSTYDRIREISNRIYELNDQIKESKSMKEKLALANERSLLFSQREELL